MIILFKATPRMKRKLNRGQQMAAPGPRQAHYLPLPGPWTKDGFYIFKWGWEDQKKNILWCENNMKLKFQVHKVYEHTATLTASHILSGCFRATTAKLSSSQRLNIQKSLKYWLSRSLQRKSSLLSLELDQTLTALTPDVSDNPIPFTATCPALCTEPAKYYCE